MSPLLALFVRTLRQSTRGPLTYALRAGIALGVLMMLWLTHETSGWRGSPGREFFEFLIAANYLAITLLGLGLFGGSIAEEKEEGNMGLLRMTDLNALAILLGKSTSRLAVMFLYLAVQVPFTFVAVTMGGVSSMQIFTAFTLLSAYTFSLANIGLYCSVCSAKVARAVTLSLLIILLASIAIAVPMMIGSKLYQLKYIDDAMQAWLFGITKWWWEIHPLWHLIKLCSGLYSSLEVVRSIAVHGTVGILFFLMAWRNFERFCGSEAAYGDAAQSGQKNGRRRRWRGRVKRLPLIWKDFHFSYGGWRSVLVRFLIYSACVLFVTLYATKSPNREDVAMGYWVGGLIVVNVELVLLASGMWRGEVWERQLGSLFGTNLSLRGMTIQKIVAIIMGLLPSLGLIVAAVLIGGMPFLAEIFLPLEGSEYLQARRAFQIVNWTVSVLFLCTLIVNFSIRLRWTAFAAALGAFGACKLAYAIFEGVLRTIVGYSYGPGYAGICLMILLGIAVCLNTRNLLIARAADN